MHESTGATKGTRAAGVRGVHGADMPGDPQPDGSIRSHMAPVPTASAKPHPLWGLLFQHSIAIATAEPQPSRHRAEELWDILLGRSVHNARGGLIQVSKGNG